jgi:hypothetical protein
MTTSVLKKQLLKKIDQVHPQDLKLIDVLLDQLLKQNEQNTDPEEWLTAEQLKDLDERTRLLNKGEVEFYTWTQVKNKVRKAARKK